MASLLFALCDDADLTEGVAQGPLRTFLRENCESCQLDYIISNSLKFNDIFGTARAIHNYIRQITSVSLTLDPVPEKLDIQEFLISLPITSFLCLASSTQSGYHRIYKYSIEHEGLLDTFRTLNEFSAALSSRGKTLTENEFNDIFDSKNRLEELIGCKIITHNVIDSKEQALNCWSCTAPGCKACGLTLDEYKEHLENVHNDIFSFMDPIWADVLRYITRQGTIPSVGDFFKPLFIGGLYITSENTTIKHVFIDQQKYDESVYNAQKYAEDGTLTFQTCTAPTIQDIFIEKDTEFHRMLIELTNNYAVEEHEIEAPNVLEDISFDDHLDQQFTLEYEGNEIRESITEPEEGHERIIITQDTYQEFINEILNKLTNANTKTDIDSLREFILSHEIEPALCNTLKQDNDTPILISFLIQNNWLPLSGFSSPFPGENIDLHSPIGFTTYVSRKEPSLADTIKDRGSIYYASILNTAIPFAEYEEETPDISMPIYFCPYLDCEYGTHNSKQMSSHTGSKIHAHGHAKMHVMGPFWTPQYEYAVKYNKLAHQGIVNRNGTIFKCTRCNAQFLRRNDLNNHLVKKHNCTHTSITDDYYKIGEIKMFTRDQILDFKAERERNIRNTLARPLAENITEDQSQSEQVNIQTENQQSNIAERTSTSLHNQDDTAHEDEILTQEEQTELEEVNEILDMRNNINNDDIINKARSWIDQYSHEEENSIGIPTMTVERRSKIKKDLKALYKVTLIPLMQKFMPLNDSEEEYMKLNGVIYKINHELREHCRKNLLLTRNQIYNRNNNNTTLSERAQKRKEDRENFLKATSLSADSSKMTQIIKEMRDLYHTENRGQVEENRYQALKAKATSILNNRNDEEWRRGILGSSTSTSIENLMNVSEDHFERTLQWLQSKVDESLKVITRESKKIQEIYADNQRKCLDHYIWPTTTPACPLTAEDFLNHYGEQWADEIQHYENPIETDEYNIDVTVGENSEERFTRFITNEKNISKIIASRNHLSAHGIDGLSNSLFRLAKKEASELFALIFKGIIQSRKIPSSWKNSKTIMIYKKDDPSLPKNWRPIGITSTMYRIFSATLSSFILSENKRKHIFHKSQKGFVGGGNGAREHINTLNELIYHIKRNGKEAVMLTIDLTNAFGSVPHQLIIDTMKRKSFPSILINIIDDIYTDNFTVIDVNGSRSSKIPNKRGVLQGCPLSPLLFNCCIDPLLTNMERFHSHDGISYTWEDNTYTITTQAYADDLVIIANSLESANRMITSLERYCNMTSLNIAPSKCLAMVEGFSETPDIKINDIPIPVTTTNDTIKYLGAPISGNKASKISFSKNKIHMVKDKIKMIFKSPLTLSQKIHAVRTYALPQIDYLLSNAVTACKDMQEIDSLIRGKIMESSKCSRIPKEYSHISAKSGGLGIPSMEDRSNKLKILSFLSPLLSKNKELQSFAMLCMEEEISKRGIVRTQDQSQFLDFQFGGLTGNQLCQSSRSRGTNSTLIRAIQGCLSSGISINVNQDNKIILKHNDEERFPSSEKDASQIIEDFKQQDLLNNIKTNLSHGHSFTGNITKTSHSYRKANVLNDKLFKFIIKSRTNTLPTEANKANWFHQEANNGTCKICQGSGTLAHLLNNCKPLSNKYTWRHNIVVQKIAQRIDNDLKPTNIKQSCRIQVANLSAEYQRLLPDIHAIFDDERRIIIIEVTIPYNQETCVNDIVRNTLDERQQGKEDKYRGLVDEVAQLTGYEVDYYTIVISSLGHVTERTESNLIQLFGNKKGKKLTEELSMSVIKASACIYFNEPPETFGFSTNDPWPSETTQQHNTIPDDSNQDLSQSGGGENSGSNYVENSSNESNIQYQIQQSSVHYESDEETNSSDRVNLNNDASLSGEYSTYVTDSSIDDTTYLDTTDVQYTSHESGNISSDEELNTTDQSDTNNDNNISDIHSDNSTYATDISTEEPTYSDTADTQNTSHESGNISSDEDAQYYYTTDVE